MRPSLIGLLGSVALVLFGCGSDDTSSTGTIGSGATGNLGGALAGGGAQGGIGGVAAGGTGSVSGGAGATPGGINNVPSGGSCAVKVINAYGLVPDMLIVLDRSTSMLQGLRWDPSKQAVKTITSEFEGLISFGLEYFPGGDVSLGNLGGIATLGGIGDLGGLLGGGMIGAGVVPGAACGGMEKLDVPLMLKNAAPIAQSMDDTFPNGFTPTASALDVARKTLGDRRPQLDQSIKPGYVLLVTDGDPRCNIDADPAQQQAARMAVQALKEVGIPTYVIGYQIDPNYRSLMNEFAMLGGTTNYYPVESGDQIVAAFRQITKDVINCTFSLDEAPADPKYVRVQIDGKAVALNAADGWVVSGKNVSLQGGACSTLKDGKGHTLSVQVECTEVILN